MPFSKVLLLFASFMLQCINFKRAFTRLQNKRQLLHALLEMTPLTPTEIVQKLKKIKRKKALLLCRGQINAPEPCYSILDSTKNIVCSTLFRPSKNFATFRQGLLNYKQASYMTLSDTLTSIQVLETHRTKFGPREFIQLKGDDSFLGMLIQGFRRLFYRQINTNFSGVDYSTFATETLKEYYIPEGADVVVLGEFNPQKSGITCIRPNFITTSKERIMTILQDSNYIRQLYLLALGILTLFTAYLIAVEGLNYWKKYQENRLKEVADLKEINVRSRVCQKCNVNLSCMLNYSCLHMSLCQGCWEQKGERNCRECNKAVKKVIQMFVC